MSIAGISNIITVIRLSRLCTTSLCYKLMNEMEQLKNLIYKKLKRINSGIRVLISSGFWKDINVKEILNDGQNNFIQKPFKFAEFNKKIDSILSTK